MPTPKAAASLFPASEEEEVGVVDNAAPEQNHNNVDQDDEDEHLFRATGFRYSFAQQRGFPYPWCAKKHGRKGWIVRDFPPTAYYCATSYPYSASRPSSTNNNAATAENGVQFEGWKEAKKVFRTRQILLQRLEQSIGDETTHNSVSSLIENNENTAVTTQEAAEAASAQRRAMIDNWFQKTPAIMKQQRKIHNQTLQLAAEKKRKREELDLKKKQQKELRVMKEKEQMQQMREKQQQQQQVSHQEVVTAAIENTNMQQSLPISNLEKDGPESPSRYRPINKQKAVVSSPSRSKRKGTQPIRRDNKYRDIERSFIENQSLLLRSPVRQTHESNEFVLPSPSTPTRMANPLPQLQSSPTRIKYKRTQPRKNHHHHQQQQQLNSSQQSNSVILGDDPLMDQMIEDIVKEFTTDGGGGPMVAHGHLFDVGAVSALREAAMDMVVHNLEEKSKVGGTPAAAAACSKGSPQLDHDDKRMELMLEQLIGEVAYDSGCKFDGHAVEALKMAAREIVTTENSDMATPAEGNTRAADVAIKSSNGEGKSEETERSPSSPSNPSYGIQPLQLDSEDSNFSEVGGMIAQLVDDLGKETDFTFDASAVDALKKASQQLI
jgi:hypothetical protein